MADDRRASPTLSEEETLLGRWLRLKGEHQMEQAVVAEPEAETVTAEEAVTEPPPDLPNIEELNAASDFTGFLREGVPEDLRKLALRKLWRSDPVLANLDGLNEYDEDFSIIKPLAAAAVEEIKKELWSDKTPTEEEAASEDHEVSENAEPVDDVAARHEGPDIAAEEDEGVEPEDTEMDDLG